MSKRNLIFALFFQSRKGCSENPLPRCLSRMFVVCVLLWQASFVAQAETTSPPLAEKPTTAAHTSPALINELRFSGPQGSEDSFVEIYNSHAEPLDISRWTLQISNSRQQVLAVPIPEGTVLPAWGHFLFAGRRYSLQAYASADAILPEPIGDGVRLCNASGSVMDAVGIEPAKSTSAVDTVTQPTLKNAIFREGQGFSLASVSAETKKAAPFTDKNGAQSSWVRKHIRSAVQDTNDNETDFVLVSTDEMWRTSPVRLGAPSPQNLADSEFTLPAEAVEDTPKAREVSDSNTSAETIHEASNIAPLKMLPRLLPSIRDAANEGTNHRYGTILLRYRFVNKTSRTIKRFRLHVTGITAGTKPPSIADVRLLALPLTSPVTKTTASATESDTTRQHSELPPAGSPIVMNAVLDVPSLQPNGGGLNSSVLLQTVQQDEPEIAPGDSAELHFLLGVMRRGPYRLALAGGGFSCVINGNTETLAATDDTFWATERRLQIPTTINSAFNNSDATRKPLPFQGHSAGGAKLSTSDEGKEADAGQLVVASLVIEDFFEEADPTKLTLAKSPMRFSSLRVAGDKQSISLEFNGPLNPDTAGEPTFYAIFVNGHAIVPDNATYTVGQNRVLLVLPAGLLRAGDMVSVAWQGLLDTQGRSVSGQVDPFVVD